jgi:predicted transcriptional regulator
LSKREGLASEKRETDSSMGGSEAVEHVLHEVDRATVEIGGIKEGLGGKM